MLQLPPRLTCIEYRKRLSQNTYTRPLYVVAVDEDDNEFELVMKVRHPDVPTGRGHYKGTSLACELICAMLARAVGLKVPDYAIIEVRSEMPYSVSNSEVRELLKNNVGANFGTVYIEGTSTWIPRPLVPQATLSSAIEDVLVFDSTVINGDRQADKSNLLWDGQDVFLIDHSVALPVHTWSSETISKSPLFPEKNVREHCAFVSINGQGRSFSQLLSQWKSDVSPEDIERLRSTIPSSWEMRTGDLDRIFCFLEGRQKRFEDTSAHLQGILQ
jgi:hypothetical protein